MNVADMSAPDWDLQEAQRIVLSFLEEMPAKVYLFGSHASGRAHRTSDIDIAVLCDHDFPVGLLADIRDALEHSNIIYEVDLVDLSGVDDMFKAKVLQEGIQWKG